MSIYKTLLQAGESQKLEWFLWLRINISVGHSYFLLADGKTVEHNTLNSAVTAVYTVIPPCC